MIEQLLARLSDDERGVLEPLIRSQAPDQRTLGLLGVSVSKLLSAVADMNAKNAQRNEWLARLEARVKRLEERTSEPGA